MKPVDPKERPGKGVKKIGKDENRK
jgi:hypothetical protein